MSSTNFDDPVHGARGPKRLGAALVLLCFASTGCSAVGAGVGAAFPRTERVAPGTSVPVATKVDLRGDDGETLVSGSYVGVDGSSYLVERGPALVRVERARVRQIVKHEGSQWLAGMLMGVALDVLGGLAGLVMLGQSYGAAFSAFGAM